MYFRKLKKTLTF